MNYLQEPKHEQPQSLPLLQQQHNKMSGRMLLQQELHPQPLLLPQQQSRIKRVQRSHPQPQLLIQSFIVFPPCSKGLFPLQYRVCFSYRKCYNAQTFLGQAVAIILVLTKIFDNFIYQKSKRAKTRIFPDPYRYGNIYHKPLKFITATRLSS